ncbi:LOW QUALITY PROTEIN: vezatin-like [Macrobrachium rosenbergii]|uniref:LOW QUALITY PROTEIN: vezatin-like n=1 Tax=Macrobrachium rosenbergii TaxID=79674 RepID=UPI0034D392A3
MSNAEEDEEVIFQGSAIDQHLQSTGYADYESTQTASFYQESHCSAGGGKKKVEWLLVKDKMLDVILSLFWPLGLRKNFYKRIVRNAYESKLLISDDLLLLKHFIPHDFLSTCQPGDHFWIMEIILWCCRWLLLCTGLCFCLIFIFWRDSTDWSIVFLMLIVTSVIWILSASWVLYKSSSEVNNFLSVLQNSGGLVSKVLRFLLEEDLVSRGFVLVHGSSSFASRNRRETPYCEGLRHALHSTLYSMLPVLHHAHNHLKTLTSCYPCIRGLFDDFEEMDAELQEDATEHLKFLKKLVTLVKLQISAVITQVILCASDVEVFENLDKNFVSFCFLNGIEKESALLLKHFTYAESFWQKDDESQEPSCEEKKSNVYLAIHSLSLHLQAALFKIQDLEKKFKFYETKNEKDSNLQDLLSYEFVKEQLNLIQSELNSCQGCLDETYARVDRKYSVREMETKKSDLDMPLNVEEDITTSVGTRKAPIPLFDLEEPIIQDEVFEAYVDEEHNNQDRESNDDFWNTSAKEERKKLKQQKEQGKRVISELQPLLNKLREVWEERETAALQRQKTGFQVHSFAAPVQLTKTRTDSINLHSATTEIRSEDSSQKLGNEKYHDLRAVNCSLNKEPGSGNLPSLESDDYDSDDERVAVYGNIKEELKRDGKSHGTCPLLDSDDERLEVYKKIRMELDAHENLYQQVNRQERDSDDERLEAYRKVRKELEMEEKSYNADSEDDSDSERSNPQKKWEKIYHFQKVQRIVLEIQCMKLSLSSIADRGSHSESVGKNEEILDDIKLPSINILNMQKVSGVSKVNNISDYSSKISSDKVIEKSALFQPVEKISVENTIPDINLKFGNVPHPSKELQEETFVHGDDTDSEDDSPHIDWSTVTLPSRLTDTLEDRMQLYHGNSIGFHAGLAAEAVRASQKFLSNKEVTTETFLGVGEGEEVFGDDESETE